MDDLQYFNWRSCNGAYYVLNLVINGWPSILKLGIKEILSTTIAF